MKVTDDNAGNGHAHAAACATMPASMRCDCLVSLGDGRRPSFLTRTSYLISRHPVPPVRVGPSPCPYMLPSTPTEYTYATTVHDLALVGMDHRA